MDQVESRTVQQHPLQGLAAEKKGGIEFYLVEQEGYDLPPYETAEKCLANFKKIHG